ncbi:DMT family transporter [Sedimentitalea nanhaiensis]|uniref:Permease of the drug/metabolite transporter (DMT) superfamily n=1 Tax=Sedimentitalea nanhaiensis TaxID=999627 RepID=A0A1I7DU50_9RHOB|nr:DMT family transporter [Sedimentitalea nanhaiensis]SFU15136.1 Permease of the drug/metabolite transporter (DMT) superfamily [Sedimentitalea nanhaiensis]
MANDPDTTSNLSGALFGLAAFAIFSIHDVIIKYLGTSYSAFQIVFFSSLLSFPLITLLMIRDAQPGTLRPEHPWWMLLRSLSGVTAAVGAFYAFSVLPLAQVYAILFAAPLLITVLSVPLLGETVRLRRGLAVGVGLLGVLVVLRPGSADLGTGHAAALVSAVFGALNAIVVRRIGNEERPVLMILYPMLASCGLMAIALPWVYRPMPLADLGALAIVAVLILFAMSCLVAAYRRGAAVVVAPMQYSQILWAALYGALLFGEYPDTMTYLGAAIIIASGLYILRRESSGHSSRNTPVLRTQTRIGLPAGLRVGILSKVAKRRK